MNLLVPAQAYRNSSPTSAAARIDNFLSIGETQASRSAARHAAMHAQNMR
jgi:hypothetical protein